MSCEFTPPPGQAQQPGACATGTTGARKQWVYEGGAPAPQGWLSAAEVEALEHSELDAEGRQLLAWVLALLGCVAAVAFVLGYTAASMGLL